MWRRDDLRFYQNYFVRLIKRCFHRDPVKKLPGLVLALEPGAGKTVIVLTALADLLDAGAIYRALIVAPLLVSQTVWPEEFAEWEHLLTMDHQLIRVEDDDPEVLAAGNAAYGAAAAEYRAKYGRLWEYFVLRLLDITPEKFAVKVKQAAQLAKRDEMMRALLEMDSPIDIINKEALPWLWKHFREGKDWPYDVMFIDDCREGRSGKKRTKDKGAGKADKESSLSRFGIMAAARKHMVATIQLTGTPTPKELQNMWGLIYLIDLGERLGKSMNAFLQRWFFMIDRTTFRSAPKRHAFDEIMDAAYDVMYSMNPKWLPELPPMVVDPVRVKLPDKVLKEYRRFKREMVSEEYEVEAVNAGVMHGKLIQFANGSMYREKGNDIWIHDCKLDALKLIVERMNGVPLLVAYDFEFDRDRILKAFPQAVHLTPNNAVKFKRDWNDDKIEIGVVHRASAGHGLNLQKGTGHMCEYGLTTDAELYLQFIKRILRSGRKTKVINHVIIAEGTIDEDVFPKYLDPKIGLLTAVLEATEVDFDE